MERDSLLLKYLDGKFKEISVELKDVNTQLQRHDSLFEVYNKTLKEHTSRQDQMELYIRNHDIVSLKGSQEYFMWATGFVVSFIAIFFAHNFGFFKDIWKKQHSND